MGRPCGQKNGRTEQACTIWPWHAGVRIELASTFDGHQHMVCSIAAGVEREPRTRDAAQSGKLSGGSLETIAARVNSSSSCSVLPELCIAGWMWSSICLEFGRSGRMAFEGYVA